MKARIGLLAILLAFPIAACGGDDDDGADAGPTADAGPPDVPVATGLTADGVFSGSVAHAKDEQEDAVLFEIASNFIDPAGEMDPDNPQSFWAYSFASLSTGTRINVTFNQGTYSISTGSVNPEGLKTIPSGWMDSDDALAAITALGFTPPGDADTRIAMTFNRQPLIMQCDDPVWAIDKINAPPGMTPTFEHWFALFCTSADSVVACSPDPDVGCVAINP